MLFKKLLIVLLTVFMNTDRNGSMQLILLASILIISYIFQLYFKPYVSDELNDLEIIASFCSIPTVFVGIIYSNSAEKSRITDLLVVLAILLNVYFILKWLWFISKELRFFTLNKFPFLKVFLLENMNLMMVKSEENFQILIIGI